MKLISFLLIPVFFWSTLSFAECNLKTDIKQVEGGFLYSNDCHRLVGKTFMDNRDREQEILKYQDLLKLSEQQISLEHDRAEVWRTTSYDLQDRVHNMEWVNEKNKLLYFGAGVILMLGASWAVGQASK